MNEEIRSLIEDLRRGNFEDPDEKIALLVASLREHQAEPSLLLQLIRAPQIPLRLAGIEASSGRPEPEIPAALVGLVGDPDSRVRIKLAAALGTWPEAVSAPGLQLLIEDSDADVRQAVVRASAGKPAFREMQRSLLSHDTSWSVRFAAAQALFEQNTPQVAPDLLVALAKDEDEDIQRRCAELLEKQFQTHSKAVTELLPRDVPLLSKAEQRVSGLGGRLELLRNWLRNETRVAVDPDALAKFGTVLTVAAKAGSLPHAHAVGESVRALVDLVVRENRRSVVLIGDSATGKSALVNELTYELMKPEHGGWQVLRVSPTDFMSGTKYLGEWETRVRDLVQLIRMPRRVLLYVPNLSDLQSMGRWSKSDASVATALAPYLEDGSVVLLGESSPEEFERGIGSIPSLQRLFDKVLVQEASTETTRDILEGLCQEGGFQVEAGVLDRLVEITDYYLSHLKRPGSAASMLRLVLSSRRDVGGEITFSDVLEVLSQSTGVPVSLLDDGVPLDRGALQRFFDSRIMGQPEALEAVVDLITLIKAGLTDPGKPFGVFLFVGPTGVGKTELARGLAEFIFGDAKKLLRFDMSEYASVEGFQRLIGGKGENGILTDAVRQQPFSVVLFDEIEKSHLNVFDLCLQLFDAGRLTDGRGRLVDFRRTIVIMTSNIGAAVGATPMGFGASSGREPVSSDKDRTWRELSRFFRPEFLNRIDRIVNFHPLSLEVAEQIARREVDLVLHRSGIARRNLTIDVHPEVTSLLVREGYSPHFGARPLKRTVERMLLMPLARAIVAGSSRPRSVISMRVKGKGIEISVVNPPQPAKTPTKAKAEVPAVPKKTRMELDGMVAQLDGLREKVMPMADRKSALLATTQETGFYRNPAKRAETFEEIRRLDQFLELVSGLERSVQAMEQRISRPFSNAAEEEQFRERLQSLQSDLVHAASVAQASDAHDLGDAILSVSLVDRLGEPQKGIEKLVEMYSAWAHRKRLSVEMLAEFYDGKQDRVFLLITGLGAFSRLKGERGLHQLDHRYRKTVPKLGKEKTFEDREVIRVEVLALTDQLRPGFAAEVRSTWKELKPRRSRCVEGARWWGSLFHKPTLRSLELWFAGQRESAEESALQILQAEVLSPAIASEETGRIVRSYDLGIGSRIKDSRTGRSTSRLAHVFKGGLDLFHE